MIKKILLILLLLCNPCFAAEQIVGFENKDLPVLNQELARINDEINSIIPAGAEMLWPTDTAPKGWLLCYGQAISRTYYVRLYNVIGTTYGVGDGSTTFNVPDWRGRFPLGQDDMGGTSANRVTDTDADTLGGADGDETKAIVSHTHGAGTLSVPAHDHGGITGRDQNYSTTGTGYNQFTNTHDHSVSQQAAATPTGSTAADGDIAAQDVMSPFMTHNYIIKY